MAISQIIIFYEIVQKIRISSKKKLSWQKASIDLGRAPTKGDAVKVCTTVCRRPSVGFTNDEIAEYGVFGMNIMGRYDIAECDCTTKPDEAEKTGK